MVFEELTAVIPHRPRPPRRGRPRGGIRSKSGLVSSCHQTFANTPPSTGLACLLAGSGFTTHSPRRHGDCRKTSSPKSTRSTCLKKTSSWKCRTPSGPRNPACGRDSGGGLLLYQTDGRPEDWPVYSTEPRDYQTNECFEMPITTFLAKLLRG